MAGHFVLTSITVSDLAIAQSKGCIWSPLQHPSGAQRPNPPGGNYPGWNQLGREALNKALGVVGMPVKRDDLPPHRYLQFGPIQEGRNPYDYIRGASWACAVTRPNMGLRLLSPEANSAWMKGDIGGAVFQQALHGQVSVEIYYVGGIQMS
jgi:hypothetical protein